MEPSSKFKDIKVPRNRLMYFIIKKGINVGDVMKRLDSLSEDEFHAMMSARYDPSLADARRLSRMIGEPIDVLFPSEYEHNSSYSDPGHLSKTKEGRFLCTYYTNSFSEDTRIIHANSEGEALISYRSVMGRTIAHIEDSSLIVFDMSKIEEVSIDVTHYNSVSSEC